MGGARAQAWALGTGRAGVLQARGTRSAQAGERQARGAGRRAGRNSRRRRAGAGCGLCTRCTRPIFDPF